MMSLEMKTVIQVQVLDEAFAFHIMLMHYGKNLNLIRLPLTMGK